MTSAVAISRKLRELGYRPVSPSDRNRQGLKVRRGGGRGAYVLADFDSERYGAELAAEAADALRDAGYTVDRPEGRPTAFYVR